MLALDFLSYAFVESRGFSELVAMAKPRYIVPCHTTFSRKIIPNLYIKCSKLASVKLAEECTYAVSAFGFTTDMRSSRTLDSYISFTICYMRKTDFKLQSIALENIATVGAKTADVIFDALDKLLDDWNLSNRFQYL